MTSPIKPLTTAVMLNRANTTRQSDEFYATFLRFPDNVSNFLAKQLIRTERPTVTFETTDVSKRGARYQSTAQARFAPITMTFKDDSEGLTSRLLHTQIFRQLKKVDMSQSEIDGYDSEYMFSVRIDRFNSQREVTDSYMLVNCVITELSFSELDVGDDMESTITASLTFENVDYFIIDDFISLQ
ncbi:MAG: hypothetical protein CMF22_11745 [Idiomarinaceae bacterium]|nr:hypothetical protein [Idiomarinaceae bacterium]|tara:strand:+ start:47245 stop:47799 length:555 start_codon:yes stop_codon:yes gene_type:complete